MLDRVKKQPWLWGGIALALVLAVVAGVALLRQDPQSNMQPEPPQVSLPAIAFTPMTAGEGQSVAEPDSAFLLEGSGTLSESELRSALKIEPEFGYALRRSAEGETADWVLTPGRSLAPQSELSFEVGKSAARFTVAPVLKLTKHYPADESRHVGITNGINLSFNSGEVSLDDLQKALSIDPPLEFSLSSGGKNSFYVYSRDAMEYGTEYTVTLDGSLTDGKGSTLGEPAAFSFTTISRAGSKLNWFFDLRETRQLSVLTGETPSILGYFNSEYFEGNENAQTTVQVQLYSFADTESYRNELERLYNSDNYALPKLIDTSGLTEYAQMEITGVPVGTDLSDKMGGGGRYILQFPEPLPEGRYLARFSFDTGEKDDDGSNYIIEYDLLLQSSDLSVFAMHTGDELVVWLNDTTTGNPAAGATLDVSGKLFCPTQTSDADGVVYVSGPELVPQTWSESGIAQISWQGHDFICPIPAATGEDSADMHYTSVMFTDRPIYRRTDTVEVWGMVRPRNAKTPMPKLTLQLIGADPVEVVPNEDGVFTSKVQLDALSSRLSSYSRLDLMADEKRLKTETLEIYDYVKPVYTSTVAADKPFYLLTENNKPRIDIEVTTFDGTPVPQFGGLLDCDKGMRLNASRITTDAHGKASVTGIIDLSAFESWHPRQISVQLSSNDAENEQFRSSDYLTVIPRDMMLTWISEDGGKEDGGCAVTLQTNRIDTSRITDVGSLLSNPKETLRGAPVSAKITAELVHITYLRVQRGVTYDAINRVTVPNYRYEKNEETEQRFDITTGANGSYLIKDLPRSKLGDYYYLNLITQDSAGNSITERVWLPGERGGIYRGSDYEFGRVFTAEEAAKRDSGEDEYNNGRRTFADGETVKMQLEYDNEPVTEMKGRLLYTTAQLGFDTPKITAKSEFSLPFEEKLVPNYTLTGAYFDGKQVYSVSSTYLYFDQAGRELEIKLETDKESYSPGDSVKVETVVTDKATGKPAQDTELVLAVVDEAIFAISSQYVNPLGSIYSPVYYPVISTYTSGGGPTTGGDGGKGGGGGGDAIRNVFRDTAAFATAQTDSNGRATISFTLPDSITSWRLTSLAVSKDNHAGHTVDNLISTKDFFVQTVNTASLIAGDELTIGLRGAGRSVSDKDKVEYTIKLDGSNKSASFAADELRQYVHGSLGVMEAGDYTVTIEGRCAGYTDSLRLPVSVKESGVEANRVKTVKLADGLDVDTLSYPVELTLYDSRYALYNEVLWTVRSRSNGDRADMRVALAVTDEMLAKADKSGAGHDSGVDLSDLMNDTAIKLFRHDEDFDMHTTAYLYLAAERMFGGRLAYSSWSRDDAHPQEQYELAAPGAFYIMRAMAGSLDKEQVNTTGFTLVDKLDLGVAYVVAGRKAEAEAIFDEFVRPKLTRLTGVSGKTTLMLPETDGIPGERCTAAAASLAIMLDIPETDELVTRLLERESKTDPYLTELLLYLQKRGQAAEQNPASISYTLDGKTVEHTFDSEFIALELSRGQLDKLSPKQLSGEVMATVAYTASPSDAGDENRLLSVTKTIEPVEGSGLRVGDLVKITLTPSLAGITADLGDGGLVLDDCLPSGMRFESYESPYRNKTVNWWLLSREEQRLRFAANADEGTMRPVIYYARCVLPGSYISEGAYLSSVAGDLWGMSERETIEIEP